MAKDTTSDPVDKAADPNPVEPVVRKPQPKVTGPKAIWPKEIGGVPGPEPTRYGDWEHKGRCTDF